MSSLSEIGCGILRTHVTWDDLQNACIEVFGEKAIFGPNKSVQSIGDGKGFMSKMALVFPDWNSCLPSKFVVKIMSQIANMESMEGFQNDDQEENNVIAEAVEGVKALEETFKMCHGIEIRLYELIKKYDIEIASPKVYKSVPFSEANKDKGFIIMDHIENTLDSHVLENVPVDSVKQILRCIANLQAASLTFSAEETVSLQENPFKKFLEFYSNPAGENAAFALMRQFGGERLESRIQQLEKMMPEMRGYEQNFGFGKELGMEPVLVHGDLWAANILWREDESKNRQLAAVVDYQLSHFGMPAEDFVRVTASCLSAEDRKHHMDDVIEYFYSYLLESLGSTRPPYSLDQLKENICRFLPMGGFSVLPLFSDVFLTSTNEMEEEEREKLKLSVLEKMECLIDEMLVEHERNQKFKTRELFYEIRDGNVTVLTR